MVKLGPGTMSKAQFREALHSILGDSAMVRCVKPKASVELQDLDELTTEEEVATTVNTALEKAAISKAESRGQKMDTVILTELAVETDPSSWTPGVTSVLGSAKCAGPDRSRIG